MKLPNRVIPTPQLSGKRLRCPLVIVAHNKNNNLDTNIASWRSRNLLEPLFLRKGVSLPAFESFLSHNAVVCQTPNKETCTAVSARLDSSEVSSSVTSTTAVLKQVIADLSSRRPTVSSSTRPGLIDQPVIKCKACCYLSFNRSPGKYAEACHYSSSNTEGLGATVWDFTDRCEG